jgi:hypothetical protein
MRSARETFGWLQIPERAWGGYFAAVGIGCLAFWGLLFAAGLIATFLNEVAALGFLIKTGVIAGALLLVVPATFAIGAVFALIPFVLLYAAAQALHIRNGVYFILGGGLIAVLVCGSYFAVVVSPWGVPAFGPFIIAPYYFLCGALGGFVYWRMVIRYNADDAGPAKSS